MRPIRKKDIDYFNTPMMTKFLNDTGKLYNRYQTRLETSVQRRVAKTIKKMRAQFVLPTVGLIKPTDKIALGSYIEEVEEMHKKTIDPVTGRLFMKHSLQDDLVVKLEREKERFEKRFGHIETMDNEEFTRAKEEADAEYKLIREMSIDNDQILPDARTRHWMVAQSHLMFEQGKDRLRQQESEVYNEAREAIREELSDEEELKQFEASEEWSLPGDLERHRAKKAYDDITRRLRTKDLNSDNLFEDLISEKAYELERVSHSIPINGLIFNLFLFFSSRARLQMPKQLRPLIQHRTCWPLHTQVLESQVSHPRRQSTRWTLMMMTLPSNGRSKR